MLKKLLLCSVLMGATTVFATAGVSDEAVKIFGTAEAKERVAKGALFIDGEFIRGPYSVTREGNVILVNGKIASRFSVKARAAAEEDEEADPEVNETDTEEAVEEETAEEASAEETADSSDEMPTLDESDFTPAKTAQTSTIEKKLAGKSGGIAAKLAERQKKKDLKKQSQGTFNTGSSYDPEALFEEADYTYTPPSKPEPKAVPYIRPEAALSLKERAKKAKEKEAEIAAARTTKRDEADSTDVVDTVEETPDSGDTDIAVADDTTETFGDLSDAEVKRYTAAFDKRRALIETALKRDYLVFLSSASSGMVRKPRNIMWNFTQSLPELCEADSSTKLTDKWGTVFPRTYLQRIYENREKNATSMKVLILRVKREAKAAKERSRNRI